ncbi:MAG TPA: hypothetical protein VKT72_06350 [Candidatus Baltobacteraceae bacterium]|nr:hypothetical protein [Candidatus Baltobacteraceae bacterium]
MKVAVFIALFAMLAAGFAGAQQNELLAPLDQAVNAMLEAAGAPSRDATRVVPIESSGGAVNGYAQIVGTASRVAATRAVVKISTSAPNGWRIDALVPVSSVSRSTGRLHREYGVAVDALVSGP